MANKWVNLEMLTYTVNKLKTLISGKANSIHTHGTGDIVQDTDHQFVTSVQKGKIDKIVTVGTGDKVLSDNGTYRTSAVIDDANPSSTTTFSGSKINSTINAVTQLQTETHVHSNKDLLDTLDGSGDGMLYLANDGTYKVPSVAGSFIDDTVVGQTDKTYSQSKIDTKFSDAATAVQSAVSAVHTHANKVALDKIINSGDGSTFLASDGNYKAVVTNIPTPTWGTTTGKPFDSIDSKTLEVKSNVLGVKRVVLTKAEHNALLANGTVDPNTLYIITDDNVDPSNSHEHWNYLILDNIKQTDIDLWNTPVADLISDNVIDPTKTYSSTKIEDVVATAVGNLSQIDDTKPYSTTTSYSSNKTEERLIEVQNIIAASQNSMAKMWQKTYVNKVANDIMYIETTPDFSIDKVIVQPYKFMAGAENVVQTIKTFDNTESASFYYDSDNVSFDGTMKIKDKFPSICQINSDGLYESEIIDTSVFISLSRIEVI